MNKQRNYQVELEQLKAAHPDLDHIPEEVAQRSAKGMNLLQAYEQWAAAVDVEAMQQENKALLEENEALKKEIAVLKQNALARARTVGGAGLGAGMEKPHNNVFLTGLETDSW